MKFSVRAELPGDGDAVHIVNEQAFGRAQEARLVDALRPVSHPQVSLVAEHDGRVVGHIFFSSVTIESDQVVLSGLGLAPMAVLPEFQRQGIGSELVRCGLNECRRLSTPFVIVLGHPEFYPRFGFVPAAPQGIRSEYDVPDDVFMIAELIPDALSGVRGVAKYHPEFATV